MKSDQPRFIYVLDPMCSWCWAFKPTIETLKKTYPDYKWELLLGGLAPDSHEPMSLEMQLKLQSIWKHIEQQTGISFNHDFWIKNTPRRSTYPACRAVITAEKLLSGSGFNMVQLIQKAYYQDAKNPSDDETLINLAEQLGLNTAQFSAELNSTSTQQLLEQQINQAHRLGAQGFPSLFIQTKVGITPLCYGYSDTEKTIKRVEQIAKELREN